MDITDELQSDPPRCVLYAAEGFGKSTFGALMPKPVMIWTERGAKRIKIPKYPFCESWKQYREQLNHVESEEHDKSTLVVDTLDWAEKLLFTHVANEANKKSISEIGFGKGHDQAAVEWELMLAQLDRINSTRGMAILLLAHAKIERFQSPIHEPYDRYLIDLHKKIIGSTVEWADAVLFGEKRVFTKKIEQGFGAKVTQAIDGQERVLHCSEHPAWVAKNRLNLPAEIKFSVPAFFAALEAGKQKSLADTIGLDDLPDWMK